MAKSFTAYVILNSSSPSIQKAIQMEGLYFIKPTEKNGYTVGDDETVKKVRITEVKS